METCAKCPKKIRSDNKSGLCHACWQTVFRENNRTELRKRYKEYRRANPEQLLLSWSRQRARKNDIEFSITEADIHIPVRCPLLGIDVRVNDQVIGPGSPTLDRKDPNRGYVPGNVQVISHLANRAKSNMSAGQMELFAINFLRSRGITVDDTLNGITCPACTSDGPHERRGASQDGSFVLAACDCGLEWKVAG